jgi:uncharacterized integral membrane protein
VAKFKLVLVLILVLLALVLVAQNTETVEARLLFATVTMPRAFLLLIALLIGYALGVLTAIGVSRKKAN